MFEDIHKKINLIDTVNLIYLDSYFDSIYSDVNDHSKFNIEIYFYYLAYYFRDDAKALFIGNLYYYEGLPKIIDAFQNLELILINSNFKPETIPEELGNLPKLKNLPLANVNTETFFTWHERMLCLLY